ncbi:MAG: helix-hairpin-helix domain-containing protein [Planctomycetes bacterium]|nr:helix-hairpin-helix domain-containing protein [Planctomycetota bacterium]
MNTTDSPGPDQMPARPTESATADPQPASQSPIVISATGKPHSPSGPWSWTPSNLVAVALLAVLLAGLVGWRIYHNRARVRDDLTVVSADVAPAAELIDPNMASWASLARLAGIGPGRAKAICAYRDEFVAAHPGQPAFTCPSDLEKVPGIGPAIVKGAAPYLAFHANATLAPAQP